MGRGGHIDRLKSAYIEGVRLVGGKLTLPIYEKSLPPLLSVKNCRHAYQGQIKKDGATTALPSPLSSFSPHQNQAVCIQIAREECGAILTHSLHSARGYNLQLVHPAGHGMAVHITAIKTARERKECKEAGEKKEPKKEERTCDLLHHKTSFIIFVFSAVFSLVVVIGLIYF